MKIKLFVTCEIQYFELRIFSFNSHVCYLTHGFIASTRAFNLVTRAFNLPTRSFSLLTRGFELVTRNSCFTFPHKNSWLRIVYAADINMLQSDWQQAWPHPFFDQI